MIENDVMKSNSALV